ncbi:hypothetical protein GCM10010433_73940 [Streptomyces pulveraceus]
MRNLIARFFEPVFLFLGLRWQKPPVQGAASRPGFPPAVAGPRRLLVCRSAMPVGMAPRPPDGPYSQAAHDRWERAENRLRRERRRALWLALHGIDVGPRVIHGVAMR